ncbi:D-alanyl-D-alanine carboxypeptidase/D-alanyl-D-alanine-endopeptidase [Hydrogenophilus thermoluteolus]|nr:D-alanyl-D-alanine carboxypeptidase/D-alanyl-D-alanine-endopeptidase [Hydrogenophilus thermoluteolus]MBW7655936.1 D-alanyl-D-alanine carboxypeptidase/D-alanyl-D-alanine-endopeptidase [Hydrogenophilus thermoluteolus]HNQ49003.1 D-alanyl-D-alanine carboxypeptidase/D-alanyl-D-alanine-endopeptidase [Hydrogenophilus thermoluteolus]HNU19945.1 D-alanyl-D-alanine carboxypeptidase/D-alanyl-D-alanine-endopeptidase [Hydrogenophilus thermoluteolus]
MAKKGPQARAPLACALAFLLLLLPELLLAAGLPSAVAKTLTQAGIPTESLSVWIAPLDGRDGPKLYYHADTPRNPASVMKLITTFAAFETFGASARWQVVLQTRAEWQGETLYGTLELVHDGDPALTAERLWTLLRTARAMGIRRIAGFTVTAPALRLPHWDPNAFDGRGQAPYTQGPAAALAHFNAIVVTLTPHPDGTRVVATTHPPLPLPLDTQALTAVPGGCPQEVRHLVEATFVSNRLVLSGRYPIACGTQTLALAPPDPNRYVEWLLTAIWQELGGTIDPKLARPERARAPFRIAASESPTLTEIAYQMNKWSNNVIARQLLALIGYETAPDASDHVAAGRDAALALLRARGIDDGHTVIDNGAGLSRTARITARTLAQLLTYVSQQNYAAEFFAGLPRLGEDGTARRRYHHHPLAGDAHVKTGTLRDVRALAGYARDRNGRPYVVAILLQHPNASAAASVFPLLLTWLAQHG